MSKVEKPIIYPQKKIVRKELTKKYREALESVISIPGSKPFAQYWYKANEKYSKRLNSFYEFSIFCMNCKLMTTKEIDKIKRNVSLKKNYNEDRIEPYNH